MKKFLTLSFLFFSFLFLYAQDVKSFSCGTDELHLKNLKDNIDYKRNFENNSLKWQDFAQKNYNKWDNSKSQNKNTNFIPPQVTTLNIAIHDMSSNSSFLPTTGTDIHAYDYIINKLNQIFNGVNLVSPENGNPTFINFCLTSKDKNGNPYTLSTSRTTTPLAGILARTTTAMTALASAANSNLLTPTNKNINIYIVDDIDGVAGFATLPSSHGQLFDGIFIERQFLINNSSLNQNMEVLAHEMGHYLGLFHVFGICDPTLINSLTDVNGYNPCSCDNNNCLFNGDMICDTAPSMLLQPANYTCNINTCSTDAIPYPTTVANINPITSNVNDNKNNYMDYGLANCHSQFTIGQITRMNFMIDPIDGPRKSLVGQSACVNCEEMNNCTFFINTNVALPEIRHEIIQTASGTPAITFSPAVTTCSSDTANNLIYSWELQFLNTNTIVVPIFTATNFTTASTLVPGNYQLTMTATFGSLCSETAIYDFVIYPATLPNCNLTLPASNSAADWTADNWNRITFTNGWAIVPPIPLYPPYNYVNGSQPQTPTSTNFNANGFDVINLVGGAMPSSYDSNFTGIILPSTANITSVIRIGEIINSSNTSQGNAYYAKKTITVNSQNCKFRVWYLGATNGNSSYINYPFHLASMNTDAAFGLLNRYRYNSPVNTITTTINSRLGFNEFGDLPNPTRIFSNNDIVSLKINSTLSQFTLDVLHRNLQWQFYDLDYSEFAQLNPNTEIELTFFAHSNTTSSGIALQKAYAYFGLECLGGGMPNDFNFNIPDQVLPCTPSGTNQQLILQMPRPSYLSEFNSLPFNNFTANFINVRIFKLISPNVYSTTPEPSFNINDGKYTLTLNSSDAPFADYRVEYRTLHKTVTDDFRVFTSFINSTVDCGDGGQIDNTFYTNINTDLISTNDVNIHQNSILLCGTNNLPLLKLTPTCITLPHSYQWYEGPNLIPGATNEDLQLTIANYLLVSNGCPTYTRRTIFTEPYCGSLRNIQSQQFKIYNLQGLISNYSQTNDSDICFGQNYTLNVNDVKLYNNNCSLPAAFNLNNSVVNTFNFQMYDPISQQGIGNIITFTSNGQLNPSFNFGNLQFTFNNQNPSNPTQPLFVPTNTNNQFNVYLQVTGTYYGCPISFLHGTNVFPLQTITFNPSAIGGSIGFICANNGITNVNAGITSMAGYGWQSSTDNITFNNIIGAPNTNNLPASFVTTLLGSNPTLFIRRVSFGFGTCAANAFSNVVIITNHPTSVIFNATLLPTTICNGSNTFTLPTTSSNGIIGTWNVATINNTTSANYTFTPAAGYCLPPFVYNLTVTNNLVPVFNSIQPVCQGESFTLPLTSVNGVSGLWSPSINNSETTTYTFTPTTNGCSTNLVTMTVVINPIPTISFENASINTSFCSGATPPTLPTTDDNGITGNWNPAIVNNTTSGNYIFTPSNSPCSLPLILTVNVIPTPCGFTLSWDSDVSCQQANEDPRVKDENIVDGPCIRVCENSTITFNINGNYIGIDHTEWNITGGTISNSTNTSCQITWNTNSFYALQGTIHLVNGTTVAINRCIEKLNAPIALFGIMPDVGATIVYGCKTSDLVFENLTTNNNGHQTIYYNWDFGDGTTSNEFEPIHNYNSSGTYNVTLSAFNGCSCSSTYNLIVIINDGNVPIQCPSVACEDEVATYSVPEYIASSCSIHWTVIGGEIVGHNSTFTLIDVLWNNIDSDGFGYVSVDENNCFTCSTVIKIPVVQKLGTIKGNATVCQKSQNLYSLPKWPTTQFNWTLNNNGTGAYLIENNQNNEIIIYSDSVGTVDLYCTYFNTLLSCGGSAHLQIEVRPNINILGLTTVCTNTNETYSFTDADGISISNINWNITGPNNFVLSGNTSPLDVTFPTVGIYNITTSSTYFCSSMHPITVTDKPQPPTAIIGSLFVCPGVPSIYSATPVAGSTTHWQVSNGSFLGSNIGDEVSIMFNPTVAGPYQVSVWYETEFCPTDLYSISVDRQPVDLTLTQTQSPVCGSSFATYAIADANADSYNWSIIPESAGSINTGQNTNEISILWNQFNGAAHVKIEVVRCSTTYLVQYLIQVINAPTVTINGATNVCKGVNTNFTLSLAPSSTFDYVEWNFGDGTTQTVYYTNSSSLTIAHQYNDPLLINTNYQVTATVHGGSGCIMPATATFNVTVSPTPVIYLTPTNGLNICSPAITPSSYNYSVNIQSGFAGTNTIQWYHNGNSIAAETNATINVQPYGIGSFYATVTNNFNCTATTQTFYVTNECGGCSAPYQVDAAVINTVCNGFQATATVIEGTPISVNWASVNFPDATIVNNTPYNLTVDNVQPGQYTIQLIANYYINGSNCAKTKDVTFTIPYKAGIKYNVSCNGSSYNVQLLDFSVYYPQTPIEHFSFTIDNGLNWYPATIVGGIAQFNTTLPPGSYPIGIQINSAGYAACTHFETLLLPAMPSAAFTTSTNNCQDNAVQFTALDNSPDLQYNWNFNDGSYNLQQNPVRVFNGSGDFTVQLTVTNKYGCVATSTQFVYVTPVNMFGILEQTPSSPCEGNSTSLHFEPNPGQVTPTSITWYHDNIEAPSIANTTAPNLDLTVNQSGYYIAHLTDANGCVYKYTLAIPVGFVPIPDIPTITGASMVCEGGTITVSVPDNESVMYNWSINGMSQPIYNGLSTITIYSASLGFYNISVTATVPNGSGGSCSSPPANIVISVVPPPAMPELSFQVITCEPYLVQVDVTNIQTDVMYYWSNGMSGPTAYSTHDGPLQVRAEINGCTATTQLDLPLDLQAIAWVFPTGCFENCQRDPLGYIIGPNGDFNSWSWLQDGEVVSTGSNEILSFNNVVPTHDYQLIIDNGFCTQTIENLNIQLVRCQKCEIRYNILTIECDKINNEYVYSIEILTDNPYTSTVFMNFLASNGEGFFVNSTLTVPPGLANHLFYFYPLAGFIGGDVMVEISGDLNPQTRCVRQLLFRFPPCVDELPRIAVINQFITMLLVAPNPAQEQTKVFYGFNSVNNSTTKKTLEVIDLLGRTILTFNLNKTKGIETLDTSRYATGQYLVILKEVDTIIKSVKLIIN